MDWAASNAFVAKMIEVISKKYQELTSAPQDQPDRSLPPAPGNLPGPPVPSSLLAPHSSCTMQEEGRGQLSSFEAHNEKTPDKEFQDSPLYAKMNARIERLKKRCTRLSRELAAYKGVADELVGSDDEEGEELEERAVDGSAVQGAADDEMHVDTPEDERVTQAQAEALRQVDIGCALLKLVDSAGARINIKLQMRSKFAKLVHFVSNY